MSITVTPTTPHFVAEISGLDLAQPLKPADRDAIEAAIDRYAIVVFHDQTLSDEQQIAFARHFGPLHSSAQKARLTRLDRAERAPSDVSRFDELDIGYVDDVLGALELFATVDDENDESGSYGPGMDAGRAGQPVVNPWRNVGRNDPCPRGSGSGSGKKAKRCCLAA